MKAFATFVMVVLAVVGLTMAGCSKPENNAGGAGVSAPAPATPDAKPAAAPAAPAAPEAKPEVKPESAPAADSSAGMSATTPAATPAAPAAAAGAPLTAESLVGTKWSASGMTFSFEKDGVLKVGAAGNEMQGTWKLEGTALTVSAMGQDFKAEIQGDKITYDGQPLERLP